jgi:hypothetical protein
LLVNFFNTIGFGWKEIRCMPVFPSSRDVTGIDQKEQYTGQGLAQQARVSPSNPGESNHKPSPPQGLAIMLGKKAYAEHGKRIAPVNHRPALKRIGRSRELRREIADALCPRSPASPSKRSY